MIARMMKVIPGLFPLLGVPVGMFVGSCFDHMALGSGIGFSLGLVIGLVVLIVIRKKSDA
jgi:hypothetical protein